jgi:hypothetical protein
MAVCGQNNGQPTVYMAFEGKRLAERVGYLYGRAMSASKAVLEQPV